MEKKKLTKGQIEKICGGIIGPTGAGKSTLFNVITTVVTKHDYVTSEHILREAKVQGIEMDAVIASGIVTDIKQALR